MKYRKISCIFIFYTWRIRLKDWDIKKLCEILEDCGKIALRHYECPAYEFKKDHSVVTVADVEIEQYLSSVLSSPEDSTFMIGEESSDSLPEDYIRAALRGTTWIVDPIDGTAPYSNRIPVWGTSIALARNGIIEEGAIYIPILKELIISSGPDIFYTDSFDGTASSLRKFHFTPFEFDAKGIISISQLLSKKGEVNMPNTVQAISSCVYSFTSMALGRYAAYVVKAKIWDIAAGWAILSKLGFSSITESGEALPLSLSGPFAEGPTRWAMPEHAVIAYGQETVNNVIKSLRFQ